MIFDYLFAMRSNPRLIDFNRPSSRTCYCWALHGCTPGAGDQHSRFLASISETAKKNELFGAITHFSPHLESEFKLLCTNVHTSSHIWGGRTVGRAELASDQGSMD